MLTQASREWRRGANTRATAATAATAAFPDNHLGASHSKQDIALHSDSRKRRITVDANSPHLGVCRSARTVTKRSAVLFIRLLDHEYFLFLFREIFYLFRYDYVLPFKVKLMKDLKNSFKKP